MNKIQSIIWIIIILNLLVSFIIDFYLYRRKKNLDEIKKIFDKTIQESQCYRKTYYESLKFLYDNLTQIQNINPNQQLQKKLDEMYEYLVKLELLIFINE